MDMNDGRVVSNFVVQALQGKGITIHGEGTQTRSFQYIDDLMEGMIKVMNTPDDFTGPVNLGNPDEFTIKELGEKVLELTGSASPLVFEALRDDDPKVRKPDITLAKETLQWEPKIKLTEGLTNTIEFFKHKF
jgi:UDP-glucuronate decarboxylase